MTATGLRILLVDDDVSFSAEMAEYLSRYAYEVEQASQLDQMMAALRGRTPDIVVLDQFLANADALESLPAIRAIYAGPLMMLTGNADPSDRIKGLEVGADDFVSKTMAPREILARIRALARRGRKPGSLPPIAGMPAAGHAAGRAAGHAALGSPGLDLVRRAVVGPDGALIQLTGAEFELMALLAGSTGTPVGREVLSQAALKRPFDPLDRAVDNLVAHLRVKLEPFGRRRDIILSVRNVGYCFTGFGIEG